MTDATVELIKLIPQRVTLDVQWTENYGDPDKEVEITLTVVVRHLRMGDLPAVLKALAPFHYMLKAIKTGSGEQTKIDPAAIFLKHSEDAMQLIAECMKRDKKWVEALNPESTLELFTRLLEVNLTFFIQRVLPGALKAAAYLQAAVAKSPGKADGSTASTPSSVPDTAILSV